MATKDRVCQIIHLVQDPEVDITCTDEKGNNGLLLLCRMNRCDDLYICIHAILYNQQSGMKKKTIDINHRNCQGWNALLMLSRYHNDKNLIDLFRLLIHYGIDANAKSRDGWNVLLLLSRHYNNENLIDIIGLLLDKTNIDINYQTNFGTNSLGLLCRYYPCENLVEVIRMLIDHGININCKNNDQRNPFSMLCRFRGSDDLIDVVKLLIKKGAEVDCPDYEGWNAFQYLCNNYSKDNLVGIVYYLMFNSRINRGWKTKSGITALEALSINWSGSFHSLLDELFVGVQFDLQSLGRIILNISLLGCYQSVRKLIILLGAVPINVNAGIKTPFDYLEQVVKESFSLCKICGPLTLRNVRKLREEFKFFKTVAIQTTLWKREVYQNQINYNDYCTYRHEGRARHIRVPCFERWQELKKEWHRKSDDKDKAMNRKTKQMICQYLEKYSHPQFRSHFNCHWCRVGKDVDIYLRRLMKRIGEIDPLFETKLLEDYGSSAEKTDLFLPGEFDRAAIFTHFRQSLTDPKQVVYAGTCPETDSPLQQNESINSSSLLFHFYKLVNAAKNSVISVQIFGAIVGYSETCVTIHFLYRGRYGPPLRASVDVTIAVEMLNPPTNRIILPEWCGVQKPPFLVPYRRAEGSHWQISYLTTERDVLLRGGSCVTKVHKLLKFLLALHEAKQNGKNEIPRKICPSSYALKTCLIRYLTCCSPPPWHSKDAIKHAIGVLKQFPMDSSELKSFFYSDVVIYEISRKSKQIVSEVIAKLEKIQNDSI